MLRAKALADVLDANVEPDVGCIFLSTTSGNLVGSSHQSQPSRLKKATILGALTWRHVHRRRGLTAIVNAAPDLRAPAIQPLSVLREVSSEESPGLQALIVDVAGVECVLADVKEGLVLGVMSSTASSDLDSTQRSDPPPAAINGVSRDENASEARPQPDEPTSQRPDGNNSNGVQAEHSNDGDESSPSSSLINGVDTTKDAAAVQRMHELLIRAIALAAFFREELHEFHMPKEI